jgi:hypothetical protein
MNTTLKLTGLITAACLIQGCASVQETYHPGYYQSQYNMPPRYQQAFYDYYGNFHAAHWDKDYFVPGRWHTAYITTELVQRQALINRYPLKYSVVPPEMVGQMGVDRFDPALD